MLDERTFRQVDRLKRFLNFIVSEALAGRGDQLKEYVIGVQVFDKDSSFDPRADPIVRVQARRLRARLVRYYREEGGADAIVIELPKGGYTPVFKQREAAGSSRRSHRRRRSPARTQSRCSRIRGPQPGERARLLLSTVCSRRSFTAWRKLEGAARARRAAAGARAQEARLGHERYAGQRRAAPDRRRPQVRRSRAGDGALVDSASASYLWSESVDVALGRCVRARRNRSPRRSSTSSSRGCWTAGQRRGARRPAENLAARNLYLQGRYHLNQRTDEGLHKALDFFEKAIVEDAQFALAHSGLADAHSLLAHYGVPRAVAGVGEGGVERRGVAVMLDGNCAEAHTSLAHVKATQDWDWHGAEREFQLAIALDPALSRPAHHWYAMSCLVPLGRLDEALDEMRHRAVARSGVVDRRARLALDPRLPPRLRGRARAVRPHHRAESALLARLLGARDDPGAAAGFRRSDRRVPARDRPVAATARACTRASVARWRSPGREPALASLRKVDAIAKQRYVSPIEFASVRFALGQPELGFRSLTKACADRAFDVLAINVDPRFEHLLGDSRFDAVLREIGLPHDLTGQKPR